MGGNAAPQASDARLVCVARRLVVVWEWDDARAHAQDHGGVDFAVRVRHAVGLLRPRESSSGDGRQRVRQQGRGSGSRGNSA